MDRCPTDPSSHGGHDGCAIRLGGCVALGVGGEEREVDCAIAAEHGDSSGRACHANLAAKARVVEVLHDANPVPGVLVPGHRKAEVGERARDFGPCDRVDRL